MEPERSGESDGPYEADVPANGATPPAEESRGPASLLTFRPRQLYRHQRGRWQLQAEASLDGDVPPRADAAGSQGGQAT